MKTLILLLIPLTCISQITLEKTYDKRTQLFDTGEESYYFEQDSFYLTMYNENHSFHKVVYPSLPLGFHINNIFAPHSSIYDNDNSQVEMIVLAVKPLGTPRMFLYDENGQMIKDLGEAYYATIHETDKGFVLITSYLGAETKVYSLPGNEYLNIEQNQEITNLPYPNPTTNHIMIPTTGGELIIRDTQGKAILKQNTTKGKTRVPTRQLPSGTYIYQTETGTGKFIKQ